MGADIHMYLEQKVKGKWKSLDYLYVDFFNNDDLCVKEIYEGRFYSFFGMLANVRSYEYPCITGACRGLPDHISAVTRREWNKYPEDWHSANWITLHELRDYYYRNCPDKVDLVSGHEKIAEIYENEEDMYVFNTLKQLCEDIEERVCDRNWFFPQNKTDAEDKVKRIWDDVRIVFWFDN